MFWSEKVYYKSIDHLKVYRSLKIAISSFCPLDKENLRFQGTELIYSNFFDNLIENTSNALRNSTSDTKPQYIKCMLKIASFNNT